MAENGTLLSDQEHMPNAVEAMETDADELFNVPLPEEDFKIIEKPNIEPAEITTDPVAPIVEERPEIGPVVDVQPVVVYAEDAIQSLYKSFGFNDTQQKRSLTNKVPRLDTIHVKGVDNMDTQDVISYFKDFPTTVVEWINDFSCNVVWTDPQMAAQALLNLSRPISRQKATKVSETETMETKTSDAQEEGELTAGITEPAEPEKAVIVPGEEISILDVGVPVPPGTWRLGATTEKSRALLMRFAFKSDRKQAGAESRSGFYQKHGNPNFGGMKGIISQSLKNKLHHKKPYSNPAPAYESDDLDREASTEPKKKFRMRMYADDEEMKIKRSRTNARPIQIEAEEQLDSVQRDDFASYDVGSTSDLRTKIRTPVSKSSVQPNTRSSGSDLRNKLDKMRKSKQSDQHFPLLIQVTRDDDETDVRW